MYGACTRAAMAEDSGEDEPRSPEPKRQKQCGTNDVILAAAGTIYDSYEEKQALMSSIEASLPAGLSKNQRKKQLKLKYREAMRATWKKEQKEKEREKRRKKRLDTTSSSQQHSLAADMLTTGPRLLTKLMSSGDASRVRVAIELGYDHLMCDQDIKKLMKQCQRCYAVNRRAEKPLQLYFTGFRGKCKQHMDQHTDGYEHWDVNFREGSYDSEFPKEDIVFLTADSPNVLKELEASKVYIIGGLVDHNHHKGHCYNQAQEAAVAHAQLPISSFVKLNSRNVLAVSHVFEILLSFELHKDWKKAFYDGVPARKMQLSRTPRDKETASLVEPREAVANNIEQSITPSNTNVTDNG